MSDTPLLIAGLGNPGAEYARNRHNAGFMAVDTIHESYKFGPWRSRFQGTLSEGALAGRKTYLLKPMTYMNDSGQSVGPAMRFFKLPLPALVVMHDEIDLAAAKLKVKDRRRRRRQQWRALDHGGARPRLSPRAHRHRPSRREASRARPCARQFLQGR